MASMTYAFEAYLEPVDGFFWFTPDGFLPIEVELDLKTNGKTWSVEHVIVVEPHIFRKNAASRELTGCLKENVLEMIKTHWGEKIDNFVAAEYEPEDDEGLTERWKEMETA